MKNQYYKVLIILFVLTNASLILPQSYYNLHWKDFNPYELYEASHIQFVNDSIGWIMPKSTYYIFYENNALFKTTDGGKSWFCVHQFEPGVFQYAYQKPFIFTDADTGYYFSNIYDSFQWKIWKTIDGGYTWSNVYTFPQLSLLRNAFFINGNIGWISSVTDLYKTTDGGMSWSVNFSFSNFGFRGFPIFFNENNGLFLTSTHGSSILYKTTNGQTWDSVASWSGYVTSVSFVNEHTGYLTVSYNSVNTNLLKTTNGGITWTNLIPDLIPSGNSNFDRVEARDSIVVFTRWFPNSNTNTTIYISTDAGTTWSINTVTGFGGLDRRVEVISILNENNIFLPSYHYVFKVADIGNVWEKLAIGPTHNLESIIDVQGGKPFAVGWKQDTQSLQFESAIISHHPLWRTKSIYAGQKLKCITAKNTSEIYIGGYDYSNGGKAIIYKCDNQGNNPEIKYNSSGQIVNSIHFFNEQNGIAVGGQGMMLKTSDGGNNWFQETSITNEDLNLIKFSSQLGFIGGTNGLLLRTSDGGINWTSINLGTNKEVKSILIHTQNKIWLVGKDGLIMRSDDGGLNWWVLISASDEYDLNSIAAMSQNHIGIYGRKKADNSPFIMETHDGGSAWVYENTSSNLQSINYVYPMGTKAWAVGDFGTILHADRWFTPVELSSFTASSSNNSVQLSWSTASELNNYGFEIERSNDGESGWRTIGFKEGKGTTTEQQNYTFTDDLFGVNSHKLYYRLKQIDYDGRFEYSNVLEVNVASLNFALHQNYPNPFNPSTKISWQSPVGSHQTLKVFDVLGREVAVLVDEYKEAGYHEVEFQSAIGNRQLASGVYYYQLNAEVYLETRKMIFLK